MLMPLVCPEREKPNLCRHCGDSKPCDEMTRRRGLKHGHTPTECRKCRNRVYAAPMNECACGGAKRRTAERCRECHRQHMHKNFRSRIYNRRVVGATSKTVDGYVQRFEPDSPMANSQGYVMEHRYVMGQALGRPLVRTENVHHLDGDRSNNDPSNLELWTRPQPTGVRVEDLVAQAVATLRTHAPERLAHAELEGK